MIQVNNRSRLLRGVPSAIDMMIQLNGDFNNSSHFHFLPTTPDMSSESADAVDTNQADFDDIGYNVPKDHIVANREPMELPSSSRSAAGGEGRHSKERSGRSQNQQNLNKYDYASEAVEMSLKSNSSSGRSKCVKKS